MSPTRRQLITQVMGNFAALRRAMACATPESDSPRERLTHAQLGVLMVTHRSGTLTIKMLAEQFSMTSSGATQLVNGLVRLGYCRRQKNPHDHRGIVISLTPDGKKALQRATKKRLAALSRMLSPLDDAELAEMHRLQKKILTDIHAL